MANTNKDISNLRSMNGMQGEQSTIWFEFQKGHNNSSICSNCKISYEVNIEEVSHRSHNKFFL